MAILLLRLCTVKWPLVLSSFCVKQIGKAVADLARSFMPPETSMLALQRSLEGSPQPQPKGDVGPSPAAGAPSVKPATLPE